MVRLSLGWMQLKKEKLRFAVALAGVGFAVVLILMQIGFRESMFESAVRTLRAMRCDVIMISSKTSFIVAPDSFSSRRLYQALSAQGVASVTPVYALSGNWENPFTHSGRRIYVLGVDPADGAFDLPEVTSQLPAIQNEDVVLYDAHSRKEYGAIADELRAGRSVRAELNNREVEVRGLFELGTSFGINGIVLTSDVNFRRLFPQRVRGLIDFGLIRTVPGSDPASVVSAIREKVGSDVLVLTREDFMEREKSYWDSTTPIGYVFSFGAIVGLFVGGIIVYQILFADVSDHLGEYATLKAIGYSNGYLSRVVIQQAVILAVLGYLPGFAVCLWLYDVAGAATHLPMYMTAERAIGVLALIIVMCCASGLIALRKVRGADPAEVFG